MQCLICGHSKREQIEGALLCRNWGDTKVSLENIAEEFAVDARSLMIHSAMHIPVANVTGDITSITDKIKLREGDLLREVANEYFTTLKLTGQKINGLVTASDPMGLKMLTTPLVELYLGTGSKIRDAIDSLTKLNQTVNGEDNSGLHALGALVASLRGPEPPSSDDR